MVKMLAANAEIPMPKVYIVPSDVPNAFATGRDPNHAAVAATSGILRILSHEELEGVMAHELTHVKNRDSLIMTIAASVTTAIMFLTRFALWFGRGRDNPLGLIGLLLMVILAPIAAILIKSAISRTREYAADRGGAEISGKPQALASALAKISGINQNIKDNPLADNTTAHLWIASPLSGGGIMNLFSTHPPTEERIKRLMEM
jgi:heat shock protein HtpX